MDCSTFWNLTLALLLAFLLCSRVWYVFGSHLFSPCLLAVPQHFPGDFSRKRYLVLPMNSKGGAGTDDTSHFIGYALDMKRP